MNIKTYLQEKNHTLQITSYLFTNQSNDKRHKVGDNDFLNECRYVDYSDTKYEKLFLRTSELTENQFIYSPHTYPDQQFVDVDDILHYHCWANERHPFNKNMKKVDFLYDFLHKH